ncbi:MAG TPA: sulfite exporter TauE/SafE family protein [Gaiellaceae bacterium]|nr:sulfite exporter TauE/SafE family protein [Gaiellaceae bacterium]
MDKIALGIALGLVAGVLAGLFGVGGGIVFVPTLALALGLDQLNAQATSLLAMLPVVAVGTWRQRRYGHVRIRPALALGVAGVAGVVVGGLLAESLPEHALQRLFAVLLLAVAGQLIWRAMRRPSTGE